MFWGVVRSALDTALMACSSWSVTGGPVSRANEQMKEHVLSMVGMFTKGCVWHRVCSSSGRRMHIHEATGTGSDGSD